MQLKFAIVGAAGHIAEQHMKAIRATDNTIVAIVDPNDSGEIGKIDGYSPDAEYFPSFEDLISYILRENEVDYITVCSPNHLHLPHCQGALRAGAQVICEKPLVINPHHLDALAATEAETGRRIHVVLQFRYHPKIVALREAILTRPTPYQHDVSVTFVLPRGKWYAQSWKASPEYSGGIAMHLGIHIFDLLLWLFGKVDASSVHFRDDRRMAGSLLLERARVRWFLSNSRDDLSRFDLPPALLASTEGYRSFTVDGQEVEFSGGRHELHTVTYQEVLAGRGFGIEDARPAIELVHRMHTTPNARWDDSTLHPVLTATKQWQGSCDLEGARSACGFPS